MNLISLLRFITSHPLNQHNKTKAVLRFAKWQLNIRLNPYPIIYPFTEQTRLIIQKGMTGATQNVYCGLHEFNDMGFLIHFLRKDDFFIDIGANIGTYTVLASGHVGAKTFTFEPVPLTFSHLLSNISINQIEEKAFAFNIALGSAKGSVNFTSSFDTMNHVANEDEKNTISVPVETLDGVLSNQEIPLLIKIDVEGFETEVIAGGMKTLEHPGLKALIIELNGSGSRYNYDEYQIHDTLINRGFIPFQYDPKNRVLTEIATFGSSNTIYIRDLNFVQERLKAAPKTKILNSEI